MTGSARGGRQSISMKQLLSVTNSDKLNRYNMQFTLGALESGLAQTWDVGIPTHLGHDLHRLIAWSRGLGVHLEPGLARLTGITYVPENEEEHEHVRQLALRQRVARVRKVVEPHLADLEKRLGVHLSGSQSACNPDCAALHEPGLAVRMFPDLFAIKDNDGLILIDQLTPVAPGVFVRDGLVLFAHSFFRRSLSRLNSLNTAFLSRLFALRNQPDLRIRIALDEDMVGLASTFREHFELEYWWGPKFSDDLEEIPIPTIARHEATDLERQIHGISRTEFWWYTQDGARSFECEELQDLPSLGVGHDVFGCRFVHSRVDEKTGEPAHLDGAIRMYNEDAMVRRLDQDIMRAGRHSEYSKLWRVDGPILVATFKELICHYYRDNKLVGEYFGGVEASHAVAPNVLQEEAPRNPLASYVSGDMKRGDGVRVHLAYNPKGDGARAPRLIEPLDWLNYGDERYSCMESDATELIKVLRRRGETIMVPEKTSRIKFRDAVVNLPLVMHTGSNAMRLLQGTASAIQELCAAWCARNDDKLLSFTLGVEYDDRDDYYSFAGHVSDMLDWLTIHPLQVPDSANEIAQWLERVYETMNEDRAPVDDDPPLSGMMQKSGVLAFKRQLLDPADYSLEWDESAKGMVAKLSIPRDNHELCDLISSHHLTAAGCLLLNRCECSACGGDYTGCLCCKTTDKGVSQIVKEFKVAGAFWTNRTL
jgi:hypothetical protein